MFPSSVHNPRRVRVWTHTFGIEARCSERHTAATPSVLAVNGVASGALAGLLHQLDAIVLEGDVATIPAHRNTRIANVRRADISQSRIVTVAGIRCTNGLQTLIDLATALNDLQWEQALESALRKRLVTVDELEAVANVRGAKRIRRPLALRPSGAPPTNRKSA